MNLSFPYIILKAKKISTEELIENLKSSLLDSDNNIIISELEIIKDSGALEVDILTKFLLVEEYKFLFTDLEEFLAILQILLDFLSLNDFYGVLTHFDKKKIKKILQENLFDIDTEILSSKPYFFDAFVYILLNFMGEYELVKFLETVEEIEDFLSKSYYEVQNQFSNETFISIENALSSALSDSHQDIYSSAFAVINNSGGYFDHLRKELKDTYRINEFITLKLVGGRTNIYVKGKLFNQCKYLLLNIPKADVRKYDDIQSIDQAVEKLDRSMEGGGRSSINITAETEFWGHCSNLQAWVENNYDTRILHRNLAFPLLRKLVEVGDPKAKQVFKDEIAKRIETGYDTVIQYIFANNFLKYLNKEEINLLIEGLDFEKIVKKLSRSKLEVLKNFADLGGKKPKAVLEQEIRAHVKVSDLSQILKLISPDYLKYLKKQDLTEVFDRIYPQIKSSHDYNSRLRIINYFSGLKIEPARDILKQEVMDQFDSKDLDAIYRLITNKYVKHLNKQELTDIFDRLQKTLKTTNFNYNTKLSILKFFSSSSVQKAKGMFKDEIIKSLPKSDLNTIINFLRQGYIKYLDDDERVGLFNQLKLLYSINTRLDTKLFVLKQFSSLGVSEATTSLKDEIKTKLKSGQLYEIKRLLSQDYLKYLDEEEINSLFESMDYAQLFNKDFHNAVSILQKFQKVGYEKAHEIIKTQAHEMIKNINETSIRTIGTKTFQKYLKEDELMSIVRKDEQKIIENLLEILISNKHSHIRNKTLNFLQKIKKGTEESLRKRIIEILINTDFDSFFALLRSKILSLLDEQDIEILLKDPKCHLREFIVIYNKRKFHVDNYLKLNLAEQGIASLTRVKGLKNLKHLKILDIRDNNISQIKGIGHLTNLNKLRIKGNSLPEALINHLGGVDHYGNAKQPQKFVQYSHRVETGKIKFVKVKNRKYEIFDNRLILKDLGLTQLTQIEGLFSLQNLQELDLSSNQITEVTNIEKLTSLKILKLHYNQIQNTTGIEKLTNLQELRLYGNNIYEVKGLDNLKQLQIVDFDTKRKIQDDMYLNYLLLSLNKDDLKKICRDYYIRGYSSLKRDRLIEFMLRSLAEEEKHEVIKQQEFQIIKKEIQTAFRKINFKENEKIFGIKIIDPTDNRIEVHFKGFNWEISSELSINSNNIDDPYRDCDCRIGANRGFCNHFWIGFIFSLKECYFKLSDWTLTPLPADFNNQLSQVKTIQGKSGEKQVVPSSFKEQKLPDISTKMTSKNVVKQWVISSFTDPHKQYTVILYKNGDWACSCPHWVFRRAYCKHIRECQSKYHI